MEAEVQTLTGEEQLPLIQAIIDQDLSEPYSV
eukprot:CAMPEP_0184684492 /NCGR_PEP_ID=MMETSP0312-20130426/15503_1 /TAXON_ID=31354 /ORGANISM="Compsopogon coeruleus, Strain SAG 36.94" /LENGTH=31 /DNA_ID= /DNA_START= /DNA_END= /DNA_ORIENTATION=